MALPHPELSWIATAQVEHSALEAELVKVFSQVIAQKSAEVLQSEKEDV
eukprot:COSAG01_NODE_739_length_13898_cov_29.871223_10_plen_49_part_00